MTVLAGVYSRSAQGLIPPDVPPRLLKAIGNHDGNQIENWSGERYFIARLDIGAFEDAATAQSDGALTAIVGDPILTLDSSRRFSSRGPDAEYIHQGLVNDDYGRLLSANGTFAGVHVSSNRDELSLFTDKVGVRQLFVAEVGELIFFASRLETLRSLKCVPKKLDVCGLMEEAALHCSMGRRTAFQGVSLLQAGEFLRIRADETQSQYYWSWKDVESIDAPLETQLAELHARFLSAIQMRMTSETQYSYLSGGMDSRCIVGGLVQSGAKPTTINFAPPNTQDQVFAELIAQRLGTVHMSIPYREIAGGDIRIGTMNYLHEHMTAAPRLIWGGNGGSVLLGHVYLNEEIVQYMRANDYSSAIRSYMREAGASESRWPYTMDTYKKYANQPMQAGIEELNRLKTADPARAFFLFLMENEQRRSLHTYLERIDEIRVEYLLPFFDAEFLQYVVGLPIDEFLYHRFYNKWLAQFPEPVSTTPWQSYPGHEPCPLEIPTGLGYQFDESFSKEFTRSRTRKTLTSARQMLLSSEFPGKYLSRAAVAAAAGLLVLGRRDYAYIIDKADVWFRNAAIKRSENIT